MLVDDIIIHMNHLKMPFLMPLILLVIIALVLTMPPIINTFRFINASLELYISQSPN
jgi:hypothetical protein